MIIKRNKGEDLPRGRELKFRDPYVYDYRKDGEGEETETSPEDDWSEEELEDEEMIDNEE